RMASARAATPARLDRAAGHGRLAVRGRGRPPGTPAMIEREYEYRLKAGRVEVRAALMAAGALLFTYLALTNDRGLILFIIPLERGAATVAYWAFAGLAALCAAADAVNVVRRADLRQRIAFTA